MKIDTLDKLVLGEEAVIENNNIATKNKQYITNLGVSKDAKIKCLYRSPFGDPTAYLIKNVIIAIREEDAKEINILRKKDGAY